MKKTILWPLWVPMILVCLLAWEACGESNSEKRLQAPGSKNHQKEVVVFSYDTTGHIFNQTGPCQPPDQDSNCCYPHFNIPFSIRLPNGLSSYSCSLPLDMWFSLPGKSMGQKGAKPLRDKACSVKSSPSYGFQFKLDPPSPDPGFNQGAQGFLSFVPDTSRNIYGSLCIILETMDPCTTFPAITIRPESLRILDDKEQVVDSFFTKGDIVRKGAPCPSKDCSPLLYEIAR